MPRSPVFIVGRGIYSFPFSAISALDGALPQGRCLWRDCCRLAGHCFGRYWRGGFDLANIAGAVAAATAKPAALHFASLGAAADLAFGGLPARAFGHGAFGANAWAGAGAARENLCRRV